MIRFDVPEDGGSGYKGRSGGKCGIRCRKQGPLGGRRADLSLHSIIHTPSLTTPSQSLLTLHENKIKELLWGSRFSLVWLQFLFSLGFKGLFERNALILENSHVVLFILNIIK